MAMKIKAIFMIGYLLLKLAFFAVFIAGYCMTDYRMMLASIFFNVLFKLECNCNN